MRLSAGFGHIQAFILFTSNSHKGPFWLFPQGCCSETHNPSSVRKMICREPFIFKGSYRKPHPVIFGFLIVELPKIFFKSLVRLLPCDYKAVFSFIALVS
jgi:hypothetical protein